MVRTFRNLSLRIYASPPLLCGVCLGRTGARQFAGQTLTGLNAKRGGGGNYNWGNPLDTYTDEYGEEDCT